MRPETRGASIRTTIGAVAGRQHGVVSRGQLRRLGVATTQIDHWVRDGRLRQVFRGAYLLEAAPLTERGRISAAVLASEPRAVVSHRSAAFLLGIGERSPRIIDLIAPTKRGTTIDGIRIHDVSYPAGSELIRAHRIPCTSVARTIIDLAGVYGERQMRDVFARAAAGKVLNLGAIEAVLDGGPRRRGAPCLRRVIEEWRPVVEETNYEDVRSLFEAKLLPLIARAKLPMPEVNALVRTAEETFEVDLLWPIERFIVEADSRIHHGTDLAFERDRHRDRELKAIGHDVLRVTWREAEREPEKIFAVVRTQLARRRPGGDDASDPAGRQRGAGSTSPT
jgi:very-short-patch-repair endonuclease